MIRRVFLKVIAGLGLGGAAGCGGGMNEGESTLATTSILRIRVQLNQTTKRTVRIPQGSTVLTAIRQAFPYRRRADRTTVINGIRGNWRYAVNDIEPRVYADNYRLTSNCRLDLFLL